MGDHPAILPATIPAMAAAGPKVEFDRERVLRLERDSGVRGCGVGLSLSLSPFGVGGEEESLEREPLRDRGSKSCGCCSLWRMWRRRPPRTRLMKASWSRISSKAGFQTQ